MIFVDVSSCIESCSVNIIFQNILSPAHTQFLEKKLPQKKQMTILFCWAFFGVLLLSISLLIQIKHRNVQVAEANALLAAALAAQPDEKCPKSMKYFRCYSIVFMRSENLCDSKIRLKCRLKKHKLFQTSPGQKKTNSDHLYRALWTLVLWINTGWYGKLQQSSNKLRECRRRRLGRYRLGLRTGPSFILKESSFQKQHRTSNFENFKN